jgi:hypothetical protein
MDKPTALEGWKPSPTGREWRIECEAFSIDAYADPESGYVVMRIRDAGGNELASSEEYDGDWQACVAGLIDDANASAADLRSDVAATEAASLFLLWRGQLSPEPLIPSWLSSRGSRASICGMKSDDKIREALADAPDDAGAYRDRLQCNWGSIRTRKAITRFRGVAKKAVADGRTVLCLADDHDLLAGMIDNIDGHQEVGRLVLAGTPDGGSLGKCGRVDLVYLHTNMSISDDLKVWAR